ncbi:MAG: hypothetical protein H0A75_05920 [Candidatus Methanofishera endochildressiae]|uniref:Uncharacterized protein n=1 Tax=Candidatus Methanofishera endochildressiae TaxID=2738884 RepID=A0A7Z0MNY5_9GAMM|nr:hypothetical protein [Candidatus Methanofishera endochildressiae]
MRILAKSICNDFEKKKASSQWGNDCRQNITNITENGTNVIDGLTKRQTKDAEQSNTEPDVDDKSKLFKR